MDKEFLKVLKDINDNLSSIATRLGNIANKDNYNDLTADALKSIADSLATMNESGISITDANGESESSPLHIRGYYDEYMARALHKMSETLVQIKEK
jgi:hypothetical protein